MMRIQDIRLKQSSPNRIYGVTQCNGRLISGFRSLLPVMISAALLMAGTDSLAQDAFDNTPSAVPATPDLNTVMENPRNPLVVLQTSQGDIHLELFPEAAPQNVQFFLNLAAGDQSFPGAAGNTAAAQPYYDGLTFHRVIRDTLIQTGAPERAGRERTTQSVIDEINARGLGLEQQRLLDASGKPHPWLNIADRNDFRQTVLVPLYRNMGINSEQTLQTQQNAVLERLQSMNLLQFHEVAGYRYDGSLPSRRPARGSVMMVNRGPGTNDGEIFIALTDMPWLIGSSTVIGRVASGMQTVEQISRSPAASTRIYQARQSSDNIDTGD